MEVKIDYDFEIIQDEKLKIKWIIEEFDAQFGDRIGKLTEEDIVKGLEFISYLISSVELDNQNPEVLSFLRCNLERLQKRFPVFFA
jgi:hypothetical protein